MILLIVRMKVRIIIPIIIIICIIKKSMTILRTIIT